MAGNQPKAMAIVAAVACAASSGAAFAQSAGTPGAAAVPADAAAPPPAQSDAMIGDIVVTATKQSQTLQRVPVAITAITGEAMVQRGITEIHAIQSIVPSARLQQEEASVEVYIRGVGATLDYPQFEPPTSINFNGIYIPREGTSVGLYDIGQVEVLPGPQGTLYGGNTLGGTINVNFRRPDQTLESTGLLEVGNYSQVHGTLTQNIPLSDVLAVRGAFDYNYHSGYQKSGAGSANNYGLRLSMLYTPTSDVSLYLWGAIAHLGGHPGNATSKGVGPAGELEPDRWLNSNPWDDQYHGALLAQAQAQGNGQVQAETWRYSNKIVGAQLDFTLAPGITLTYIPSYLKLYVSPDYWLSAVKSNKTDHYEQTTHELRLSGKTGPVNLVGGLYGYYRTGDDAFYYGGFNAATGFPVTLIDHTRIKGIAGFGQAIVTVTEGLRVTAGGRYSLDDRVGNGRFFNGAGLSPYTYSDHFHHFDYKFGIDYDLAPRVLIYAGTQSGYQPGTFNPFQSTPTLSNKLQPAKLKAYTVGFKSRFLDDHLQLNSEFFYYDYRGLFISAYDTVNRTNRTFNAQKVEIYGNQTDIVIKPAQNDQITGSVGYLHGRYKQFTLPDGTSFNGLQLQNAPTWTLSGSYRHDFQMANGYLRAEASSNYESSFFGDYSHAPGTHQKGYAKVDASLTYHAADGRWTLGAWGRNLTNFANYESAAVGSAVPFNPRAGTGFIAPPRTFGLRGTIKL